MSTKAKRHIDPALAQARREQVLSAASECFKRKGYHGAGMAEISRTAGMSAGHIYNYFESKEAIIESIIAKDMEEMFSIFHLGLSNIMPIGDLGFINAYKKYYNDPDLIKLNKNTKKFDPNSVSAERIINLANEWRLTGGNPVVMLPGRLTRWKGQLNFIMAISKLSRPDLRCLLVGGSQGREKYKREIEDLIRKHELEEKIRIVDHCNDMPAAYMLADVVVSASLEPEAFGRVIVEAQALGRPVVATDHGGARETIVPGHTGWLVKPGNIVDLSNAIEEALSLNENDRSVFFTRGIENVHNNFSKDEMCVKTLNVYNEVLKDNISKNS